MAAPDTKRMLLQRALNELCAKIRSVNPDSPDDEVQKAAAASLRRMLSIAEEYKYGVTLQRVPHEAPRFDAALQHHAALAALWAGVEQSLAQAREQDHVRHRMELVYIFTANLSSGVAAEIVNRIVLDGDNGI